jgi:hypothetical protein
LRRPRLNEGVRAALRVLVSARHSMTTDRTCAVNALTALLRSNDMELDARKSLTGTQILEVSRWRTREEPQKDQPKRNPPVRETLARPTGLLNTQRQQIPSHCYVDNHRRVDNEPYVALPLEPGASGCRVRDSRGLVRTRRIESNPVLTVLEYWPDVRLGCDPTDQPRQT